MSPLQRLARVSRVCHRSLSTVHEPGVFGLPKDDNPRQTLAALYTKTLDAVKEIPDKATYRSNVEKITKYRMDVVTNNDDVAKMEAVLGIGQIDEIIEQAQNELQLIGHMKQWQPWNKPRKAAVIEVVE